MKQRTLKTIIVQGAIEKSKTYLFRILEKKRIINSTIMISHFGGTNDIFTNYNIKDKEYLVLV